MAWIARVLLVLLTSSFGVFATMADELADFDAATSRVVVASPEFAGIAARTAKRRLPSAAPGSTGLEYLVFSDDVRVAVVNHQWAVTPATWPTIDLVQYIGTVNPDSPLEKKIGDAADYARGAAGGRTTQFTLAEGSEGMACVAYDIKTAMHRLTGFICLPGTAPLSPADAKRLVDGIGIKGELAPG
jgi:hypothetical protein